MTKKYWLLCFCLLVLFCACEQDRDPCLQPTNVYLRVKALRHVTDTTFADTLLVHPRWTAIDTGVTLVYLPKTSAFNLLLNPKSDSCRYALQADSAVNVFDTLTFYYDHRLQFLSNACGYTYFYTLHNISTTLHNLDSVKLKNEDVNSNVNTPEHVQVFF